MMNKGGSNLERSIKVIDMLDRPGCLSHWREVFGRLPPKYLSPQFMKRVLIWELQNRELGDPSAKSERRLQQIAPGKTPPAQAKPGSHLVREAAVGRVRNTLHLPFTLPPFAASAEPIPGQLTAVLTKQPFRNFVSRDAASLNCALIGGKERLEP